jgi:hypothetical protein
MAQLPAGIDIVNLSLGGYTEDDKAPIAIANVMQSTAFKHRVVLAAAGNHGKARPFWPAASGPVVSVGAVEDDKEGFWRRASYSNHGGWVDLVARGTGLRSTFAREKTLVAQGPAIAPATDPTVAFEGWAEWDGTSFATPIAAAMVARTMTRTGIYSAPDASVKLQLTSPSAPLSEFPNAKLVDELR